MRFLQPREVDQATEATGHDVQPNNWDNVSLVTLNVDGLGEYAHTPKQRIAAILEYALSLSPDVLHLQEMTFEID